MIALEKSKSEKLETAELDRDLSSPLLEDIAEHSAQQSRTQKLNYRFITLKFFIKDFPIRIYVGCSKEQFELILTYYVKLMLHFGSKT